MKYKDMRDAMQHHWQQDGCIGRGYQTRSRCRFGELSVAVETERTHKHENAEDIAEPQIWHAVGMSRHSEYNRQ